MKVLLVFQSIGVISETIFSWWVRLENTLLTCARHWSRGFTHSPSLSLSTWAGAVAGKQHMMRGVGAVHWAAHITYYYHMRGLFIFQCIQMPQILSIKHSHKSKIALTASKGHGLSCTACTESTTAALLCRNNVTWNRNLPSLDLNLYTIKFPRLSLKVLKGLCSSKIQ